MSEEAARTILTKRCKNQPICIVICLFSDASTGESDVIRVFNPKMRMTPEKLKYILSKAKLELAGFNKSEKTRYETDENGKRIVKKITYYIVQDDCSQSSKWDSILRERLPKQVQKRIVKYCSFIPRLDHDV